MVDDRLAGGGRCLLAHVAALTLLPLSLAQAVLSGGFVLLAVLAERFFGFQLGRRQWVGIVLVAVSLALLGLTRQSSGGDHSDYSTSAMIVFDGVAIAVGMMLIFSGRMERARAQYGVLLGAAAGLGFGISDVAIKALRGDLESGIGALVSPWTALVVTAAVASFFASARSLPGTGGAGRPGALRTIIETSSGTGSGEDRSSPVR